MKTKLTITNVWILNRRQSYAIFRPNTNFLAFISPTCSDNRPHRRQIKQTRSKLVLMGAMGAGAFAPLCHTADGWLWSLRFRYTWRCLKSVMMRKAWGNFVDPYYNTPRHKSQNRKTITPWELMMTSRTCWLLQVRDTWVWVPKGNGLILSEFFLCFYLHLHQNAGNISVLRYF